MKLNELLEIAKREGASEAEVYYSSSKRTSFEIYEQEMDSYESSTCHGYSIRALFDGKCGVSYSEDLSENAFEACVKRCKENAAINESDDVVEFAKPETVEEIQTYHPQLNDVNLDEMKQMMADIEKEVKESDERIIAVSTCAFEMDEDECIILNTLGVDLSRKTNYVVAVVGCNAKDENGVVDAFKIEVCFDLNKLNKEEFVREVTEEVLSKLSPKRMASGQYPVILKNKVSSSLLGSLSGMFNAENIQKDLSVLKGKKDQPIFSEKITIMDDPLLKDGYNSFGFDDEGTPCKTKTLVENGIFKQALYSRKAALKEGVSSSGNGFKSSYVSDIAIRPTNLYIQPQDMDYEEMVAGMDEGLIITEISGLHAGLNPLTTDFSLLASGYFVKNGKIEYPVNLITIAANYMEMMNHIEMVGNDLKFSYSGIGSPSLKISRIAISGE